MITIKATGDTTLHTAGKYCPEDILVQVPSGEDVTNETNEYTNKVTILENTINELKTELANKAAGSETKIETWSGWVSGMWGSTECTCIYTSKDLELTTIFTSSSSIEIVKNTLIYVYLPTDGTPSLNNADLVKLIYESTGDVTDHAICIIKPTANNFNIEFMLGGGGGV